MTVPSGPIPSFTPGKGLQDGTALQKLSQQRSTQNAITAQADGTKANATPIISCLAHIETCAGNGNSVLLPPGYPGLIVHIFNNTAYSAQVFGAGTDTINGVATGIGVAQAAGLSAIYTCYNVVAGVGKWGRVLSA